MGKRSRGRKSRKAKKGQMLSIDCRYQVNREKDRIEVVLRLNNGEAKVDYFFELLLSELLK